MNSSLIKGIEMKKTIISRVLLLVVSCSMVEFANAQSASNQQTTYTPAINQQALEQIESKAVELPNLSSSISNSSSEIDSTATENTQNSENSTADITEVALNQNEPLDNNEIVNLLANENVGLKDVYEANNYQPIWDNSEVKKKFLDDYILVALSGANKTAWQSLEKISGLNTIEQDIEITRALLDYVNYSDLAKKRIEHLFYATKDYNNSQPKKASLEKLKQAIKSKNIDQYLTSLQPKNRLYKGNLNYVKNVLASGVEFEEPVTATLRFKAKGKQVLLLVNKLKAKKYLPADFSSDVYDENVLSAVKQFQTDNNMKADGIVGAKSRAKLNDNPIYLAYKLALNSQRIRMLSDFNNGLFVNIPAFELKYFQNGELKLTSRVIVGKGERKTPVMFSRLSDVVLNPPWNAPTKLINEDIIPKVKNDPSYIYRNGYTIIDSKGNSVDPYTIDWENYNREKFPYRLRQRPSDNSALGSYKFNMPSKDAIFLHDTPSKGLFKRNQRALSSGCIRVEQSQKLANILLTGVGFDENLQQEALENKKTKFVKLNNNNAPVYIYYMTAWVDENTGNVELLPDLYGYDDLNMKDIDWNLLKKVYNLN